MSVSERQCCGRDVRRCQSFFSRILIDISRVGETRWHEYLDGGEGKLKESVVETSKNVVIAISKGQEFGKDHKGKGEEFCDCCCCP
jgi:hypothetical protein